MKIYFDLRTNEFVKEMDSIMPPEFYFVYELGVIPDMAIEKYELPNGDKLDYSYSVSMRKYISREMENINRRNFFEKHLGKSYAKPRLLSIVVPRNDFISYCEEAGFDDYVKQLREGVA